MLREKRVDGENRRKKVVSGDETETSKYKYDALGERVE